MTGTLLKRLEQHISWSSQKHLLPLRGALRKSPTQASLLPRVNTERFKASFMNRLYFKYTFTS